MSVSPELLFGTVGSSQERGPTRRADALLGTAEATLIEQIRAGDEAVYTRVYAFLAPRLIAIAQQHVPVSVAEEITQDVLLSLWEQRQPWPAARGITVYLYTVVRRRAIDHARHQGVVGRVEAAARVAEDSPGAGAAFPSPDEAVDRHDLAAAIERALEMLSERPRTAFVLRWIHQLGYAEVAEIMGVNEATARKLVSRARESLLELLRDYAQR
jgi:RNA polymerase sigma-70 factor (ECF subfamily)